MHRCSFLLLLCITPPPNSSSWASKLANWIFGSPIIIYSKRRKVNTPHHIDGFLRWNRIAQAKLPKIRPNASIAASSTSFDTHWAMHIHTIFRIGIDLNLLSYLGIYEIECLNSELSYKKKIIQSKHWFFPNMAFKKWLAFV